MDRISSGYKYVAAFDTEGKVHIRTGISEKHPAGTGWTSLNWANLKDVSLYNNILMGLNKDGKVIMANLSENHELI